MSIRSIPKKLKKASLFPIFFFKKLDSHWNVSTLSTGGKDETHGGLSKYYFKVKAGSLH